MRVRVTVALGLTAVTILALPACSADTSNAKSASASSAHSRKPTTADRADALSPAELERRLLDESDLGAGYIRKPERPAQHDAVTVLGCPALQGLGGDAATGGSPDFSGQAKASFVYANDSHSEVSEELYSDTASTLSDGIDRIFDAMTGCPQYQVLAGSTAIDVMTQKTAPPQLGDEQWSQLMTLSAGGQNTVVKQTAIRDANLLVIVSGSPALVDLHLEKALAKASVTG
ncbi:hypothetical protein SUDANB105_00689 [Streptomyces sp. enrichment culture]|uniref:hypothetical protein n=1 Tax=Streptomyces sp. enrichment culture TaxID=1795815 RepID=UPI003F553F5C